jgi:hypothetical protein
MKHVAQEVSHSASDSQAQNTALRDTMTSSAGRPDDCPTATIRTIISALVALGVLGGTTLLCCTSASAHSWYPKECCNDMDCAPVESMTRLVPAGGGLPQLVVTSKHGKAFLPRDHPVRQSQDGRMHVCMRHDPFGEMEVICFFVPPSM